MTSLQAQIGKRPGRSIVFSGPNCRLLKEELLSCRPVAEAPKDIVVSILAQDKLLRVLSAFDGRCDSILLLSDALAPDDVCQFAARTGAPVVISDRTDLSGAVHPDAIVSVDPEGHAPPCDGTTETAWLLTTSGTTGTPKIVAHTLAGLTRTVRKVATDRSAPVWGLTYEATRFAGLQVILQAICGGGTLVAVPGGISIGERLQSFCQLGVTHISATPTLWRQFLMHPESRRLAVQQVTLGGEIADQQLLDTLRSRFPDAHVTHIYASTETGVGFSVQDGREGFPKSWLVDPPGPFGLRIVDGMLWVRSGSTGESYLDGKFEQDDDGYVNTLDRVAENDDRIIFLGRATGAVNVGGAKVFPEYVENLLNQNDTIALSHVAGRKNPFSGSILVAKVVPKTWPDDEAAYKKEILRYCGQMLPPEAVPAVITLVREIDVNASGKLTRK